MQIQQRLCHPTAFRIVCHAPHFTGRSNQKQVIVYPFEMDDSIVKTRFPISLNRNIPMQGIFRTIGPGKTRTDIDILSYAISMGYFIYVIVKDFEANLE